MGYRYCCPDNYLYVTAGGKYVDPSTGSVLSVSNTAGSIPNLAQVSGKCAQFINKGYAQNPVELIDCPCCPSGTIYANNLGAAAMYVDPLTGVGDFTGTFANSLTPGSTFTPNKCNWVSIWAPSGTYPPPYIFYPLPTSSGLPTDPLESCPCCNDGYYYNSVSQPAVCSQITNPRIHKPTIPCLDCNCVEPPVFSCEPCGTAGEGINFQYDFNNRTCEICTPVDLNPPKGKITCFMPLSFSDPDTTFTLANLNYI